MRERRWLAMGNAIDSVPHPRARGMLWPRGERENSKASLFRRKSSLAHGL